MGKNEKSRQENIKRLGLRAALLASTALILVGQPAAGQTVNWTGSEGNELWTEGGNWSGGAVPTAADNVVIDELVEPGGFVTLSGDDGKTNGLIVGNEDSGQLAIIIGANLEATGPVYLGYEVDSIGLMFVAGEDSELIIHGHMASGSAGNGILYVSDGAIVRADTLNIAEGADSEGFVLVQDGTIELTSNITIGHWGQGELRIEEGGYITNNRATLGFVGSGSGFVIVDGGEWENTSRLTVGQGGQGRLEVLNGGTVTSVDVANIGNGSESSGEVLVSGNRSSWTHVGDLTVGHNGEGQLEITNRGAVHVDKAIVVGATGKGILTISNGGEVSVGADEDIWLAMNTNSEGVVVSHGMV